MNLGRMDDHWMRNPLQRVGVDMIWMRKYFHSFVEIFGGTGKLQFPAKLDVSYEEQQRMENNSIFEECYWSTLCAGNTVGGEN